MKNFKSYGFKGPSLKVLVALSEIKSSLYHTYPKKKKSGGFRMIDEPCCEMKGHQRFLYETVLSDLRIYKPCTHGFIQGRSIESNALCHTKKEIVVNLDIKNFFSSITKKRVKDIFLKNGWNIIYANILANFCTYKGVLPQGAPTSPMLTNAICHDMDKKLYLFCLKNKIKYTRYADDMTFSGKEIVVLDNLNKIKSIVKDHDFVVNEKKTSIMKKHQRQVVTGLVVNEKVNVKREKYMLVRQQIYYCNKYGVKDHLDRINSSMTPDKLKKRLTGQVYQIRGINLKRGNKLLIDLFQIDWNS